VEHPCYQCNTPVEDGTAFCPHCGAAQIRVASEEIRQPDEPGEVLAQSDPVGPVGIQWSQALPSAALAGLIAAGLMFILARALILGMIAAGVLAVLFYRRRNPRGTLSPGTGACLGAVSGVLGFGIFAVFTAIEMLVFHSGGELRAFLLETIEQSAQRASDPQAQQYVNYLKSPPGLALFMALMLVGMFFIFLILASLGGSLAASLLQRRERL
jgi:hypothetical protein